MTVEMTPEVAAKLREPFPAEAIGYVPRIWCKACGERKPATCDRHEKIKCQKCRNNITSAHIDLSYVGHAETTDRLNAVDPSWTWEPLAFGPDGLPKRDDLGGLWIRLTIAGVTRLGYGAAEGKRGADAVKEIIGDALRNGALRFGVAIDLWGASGTARAMAADDGHEPDEHTGPGDAPGDRSDAAGAVPAARNGQTRTQAAQATRARVDSNRDRVMNGGEQTEPQRADPLAAAVTHMLNAANDASVGVWPKRIADNGAADTDVTHLLTDADRDALRIAADETVTAGQLAELAVSFVKQMQGSVRAPVPIPAG